jgi:hypothetical protein
MHKRLVNELVLALARAALAIIAPCLREEERGDAFHEFCQAFRDVILLHEEKRNRMQARLRGQAAPRPTPGK